MWSKWYFTQTYATIIFLMFSPVIFILRVWIVAFASFNRLSVFSNWVSFGENLFRNSHCIEFKTMGFILKMHKNLKKKYEEYIKNKITKNESWSQNLFKFKRLDMLMFHNLTYICYLFIKGHVNALNENLFHIWAMIFFATSNSNLKLSNRLTCKECY